MLLHLPTTMLISAFAFLVLAGGLLYLWWQEKQSESLLYWSAAYLCNALRLLLQWIAEPEALAADSLFIMFFTLLWAGVESLRSRQIRWAWIIGTAAGLTLWNGFAALLDLGFFYRALPIYSAAALALLLIARAFWLWSHEHPALGYRPLAVVFVLYAVHVLGSPLLQSQPDWATVSSVLATVLVAAIGVGFILSTQRREWEHSQQLAAALQQENQQRQQAETELHRIAAQYRNLYNRMPVMIHLDDHHGIIQAVNDQWIAALGYERSEVLGRLDRELFTPACRRMVEAIHLPKLKQMVEQPPIEIQYRKKDGGTLDAILWAVFDLDSHGRFQQLIVVSLDITERKRIEQALRDSESKFMRIFQLMPDMVIISDLETREILDVNPACEALTALPSEQVLGVAMPELKLWYDPAQRDMAMLLLKEKGEVRSLEVQLQRHDGRVIWCEYSCRSFELKGRTVLVSIIRDINDKRRVQTEIRELNISLDQRVKQRTAELESANHELGQALRTLKVAQSELVRTEKLASLGSLVAGIAHELNTPIGNSVTVASTLVERNHEFSQQLGGGPLRRSALEHYLESMRLAGELLMRNLAQARDLVASFKQVAVDQTSAQRRPFDLKEVLEEIVSTLNPRLKKTSLHLQLDLAEQVQMDSYPGPLGQVITNLIINSQLHGFDGRDKGEIQLVSRVLPGNLVEIIVVDNGNGIPEQYMDRIFDPFFTTKLGQGGSGLGLHIVYSLVSRVLGGKIQVESQAGAGTRFCLILPCTAPTSSNPENAGPESQTS